MFNTDIQMNQPQGHGAFQTKLDSSFKNVLFLSDLPENISENELTIFFNDFREFIALIQVNSNVKNDPKRSPTATVHFKDFKKADEARNALNLLKIKGRTVRIMWHERDTNSRYSHEGNLFVKNVPENVKPREFYELFLQFGDIVSAKLNEDNNGNHVGYGYVHYSSQASMEKALDYFTRNKAFGVTLDVKPFQKKNERLHQPLNGNKNVYVNNIPIGTKEGEVKDLFKGYGNVTYIKLQEENQRMFATLSLDKEESSQNAIKDLNGINFKGNEILVNPLINKANREKLQQYRPQVDHHMNPRYKKGCNLHVKNIPYDVTDQYLKEVFSKYGEVESAKIQNVNNVYKDGNEVKTQIVSQGFGYVGFSNEESAQRALDDLNGKKLPKYETWNRPLIINVWVPKNERNGMNKQMANFGYQGGVPTVNAIMGGYGMNPMSMNVNQMFPPMMYPQMGAMPMYAPNIALQYQPNQYQQPGQPNAYRGNNQSQGQGQFQGQAQTQGGYPNSRYNNSNNNYNNKNTGIPSNTPNANAQTRQPQPTIQRQINEQQTQQPKSKNDQLIDISYLNSLEEDNLKKDYLGEIIFKKIESHDFSRSKNLTIDTIGKITGMILGIEDISEIVEIARNNDQLTQRMEEAIELLESNS